MAAFYGLHLLAELSGVLEMSAFAFVMGAWLLVGVVCGRSWLVHTVWLLGLSLLSLPLGRALTPLGAVLVQPEMWIATAVAQVLTQYSLFWDHPHVWGEHFKFHFGPECTGINSLQSMWAMSLILGHARLRTAGGRLRLLAWSGLWAMVGNTLRLTAMLVVAAPLGLRAGMVVHDSPAAGLLIYGTIFLGLMLSLNRLQAAEHASASGQIPDRSQAPGKRQPTCCTP